MKRALDRMQTDCLDLLQYHTWNYTDPSWLDTLFYLQELKEEGLIHYLGLVNVDTAHLRITLHSGFDIVSNQVCFSLIDQRANAGMTALCREHGIKLLAFGTVAGGFLTERWLGKPEPHIDELETWSENTGNALLRSDIHLAAICASLRLGSLPDQNRNIVTSTTLALPTWSSPDHTR